MHSRSFQDVASALLDGPGKIQVRSTQRRLAGADNRGMKLANGDMLALDVWTYFYLHNGPTENEEKPWRRIECAAWRIRESLPYLDEKHPAAVRFRNARRVQRATREIVRMVEKLESVPDMWIARAIGELEGWAEHVRAVTCEEAKARPLH